MTYMWDSQFEELLRQAVPSLQSGAIDPAEDLQNAGLDSIASVELLLQIEAAYDIIIPDEALTQQTFTTPCTLWGVVAPLIGARPIPSP
ncbi:phosphopantetheine-binding protein [Nonomuraea wenchangensis]|uniref:phosphopantetheine-binding protein n=1 Tax=Nonomuraea wenchangensis TaxID=568860 RepID=UPI0037B27CBE